MTRHFKYSGWKLLGAVVGIAILIGLGAWQLQRLQWKEAMLQLRAERTALSPLNQLPNDYDALKFRRANLTGLLENDKMIFLGPRTFDGRAGYHYLTPMLLGDGRAILVNQGFIPAEYAKKSFIGGHVQTLSGTLVEAPLPGPFTPVNPPIYNHIEGDKYYWVDLLAIGNALGTPRLVPLVFELDKIGEDYPIGGQWEQMPPNNHLQYAIFWFTMAGVLLLMYLLSSFKSDAPRGQLHARKDTDSQQRYPNLWS